MTKRTRKQRLIVNGGYFCVLASMLLAIHFVYLYWDRSSGFAVFAIGALYVVLVVGSFKVMNWIQSTLIFMDEPVPGARAERK